ncbi:FAD/NAD(P)-binding protein [Fundidesulfovibrio soli]|uniref:FAD/NAD(P)-binding protein n=1 Tax=Fundidesulfovibrio soli TaxID=2922716 RepID=UPI001FAF56E5|nr:FAD/NAD(P)-binding protein [Fundidesulfovibrio soli]
MTTMMNPYLPEIATVLEVIQETPNIKTFRVVLNNKDRMAKFKYEPGQVGQLSVFGVGEATFVINSPPTRMEYLQFSVMLTGEVTSMLHTLSPGDQVGVRAPLGNWFPYESMKGKNVVFIGGGIGMAPLRTLLLFMLDNRKDYKNISLLYGARSPEDMAFKYDLPDWSSRKDMTTVLTIDREAPGWEHKVGLIPNVLLEMNPSPKKTVAITCGPPIMIKFTLQALKKLGFEDDQIVTTLEKRMKCGVGICGRCNIGTKYVCMDGPVFTYAQLKELPNEL